MNIRIENDFAGPTVVPRGRARMNRGWGSDGPMIGKGTEAACTPALRSGCTHQTVAGGIGVKPKDCRDEC